MELTEVVAKLKEVRLATGQGGNWSNPNSLSEIGLKLATYLTYLGEYIPQLEGKYLGDRSEHYSKLVRATSASAAETQARYLTIKQRQQYETVKQMHKDFGSLISMIQTRLRVLDSEAKGNI